MKEFLKDYGSLVGPTLAFIFSLLTILIKDSIDLYVKNRNMIIKIKKLNSLIINLGIDNSDYYEDISLEKINDLNRKIIYLKKYIDRILDEIEIYLSLDTIADLENTKNLLKILETEINEALTNQKLDDYIIKKIKIISHLLTLKIRVELINIKSRWR
ncbi:TPA: hypothetical protein I9135_003004 [Clostridium perfringens]|nr:hypothetical protein [Clostridium perfringens]HAT4368420.1 hypothetical protein [Clostridium perfringens]